MSADFDGAFRELRPLMLRHASGLVVSRDVPGELEVRTQVEDPRTGEPGWFGSVTIKKSYVAYHLIPLYARPELADGLSPALTKRRQGKTCFNFKRAEPELFAELDALTRRAAEAA